jgi:hypothetical protein
VNGCIGCLGWASLELGDGGRLPKSTHGLDGAHRVTFLAIATGGFCRTIKNNTIEAAKTLTSLAITSYWFSK